jgi:hypothetical protein
MYENGYSSKAEMEHDKYRLFWLSTCQIPNGFSLARVDGWPYADLYACRCYMLIPIACVTTTSIGNET